LAWSLGGGQAAPPAHVDATTVLRTHFDRPGWALPLPNIPWPTTAETRFHPQGLPVEWKPFLVDFSHIPGSSHHVRISTKDLPSQNFVVKRVEVPNAKRLAEVKQEVENLAALHGKPGVITLYASTAENAVLGDEVYIVMEEAQGNLRDLVMTKSIEQVTFGTRLRLFADVLRAVAELARLGKAHRDLDPSNILIVGDILRDPDNCRAVICDFQHMCTVPGDPVAKGATRPGHPYFTAPEAWDRASAKQDVWSCGMLLFQMITGMIPETLDELAEPAEVREFLQTSFRIEHSRLHQQLSEIVPELAALLQRMLEPDPRKRCSAEEAFRTLETDAARHGLDLSPRGRAPPALPKWLEGWAPAAQAASEEDAALPELKPAPGLLARMRKAKVAAPQGVQEAAEPKKPPGVFGRLRSLLPRDVRLPPRGFGRAAPERRTLSGPAAPA